MSSSNRQLARAKLTRTFRVVGRRPDGYHLIDAEMVALDLADELEISDGDGLEVVDAITWTGSPKDRPDLEELRSTDNLVVRALVAIGKRAHIRLTKRIPRASGLGGGSSDAAAVMRWAGSDDLEMAAAIGADVPFCLHGGRARVTGIGERLTPLAPLQLSLVLVTPAFSISTAAVYAAFDELGPRVSAGTTNDLESAALSVEPRLKRYRDLLRTVSSSEPHLAGSGGTWFVECPPAMRQPLVANLRAAVEEEGMCAAISATTTDG
jgi:4-diphosphocytidyl-2-C-methyl-D-erythritol kinase